MYYPVTDVSVCREIRNHAALSYMNVTVPTYLQLNDKDLAEKLEEEYYELKGASLDAIDALDLKRSAYDLREPSIVKTASTLSRALRRAIGRDAICESLYPKLHALRQEEVDYSFFRYMTAATYWDVSSSRRVFDLVDQVSLTKHLFSIAGDLYILATLVRAEFGKSFLNRRLFIDLLVDNSGDVSFDMYLKFRSNARMESVGGMGVSLLEKVLVPSSGMCALRSFNAQTKEVVC